MKRRMLSIILTLAMILSMLPAVTLTAAAADDGVIEISTAAGLVEFRDRVNSGEAALSATLTADIDLSGICGEGIGNWTPIGSRYTFAGTFDGGGHEIIGLYINASGSSGQGLFGYVGSSGMVKNVGVNGQVTGGSSVGGVVGQDTGATYTNCYFNEDAAETGIGTSDGVVPSPSTRARRQVGPPARSIVY